MKLNPCLISDVPFFLQAGQEQRLQKLDLKHLENNPGTYQLKHSLGRTVYWIEPLQLILKIFRPVTLWDHLRFFCRPHKGAIEFQTMLLAEQLHLSTSVPLGYGARYQHHFLKEAYLLIEALPEVRSFQQLFQTQYLSTSRTQKNQFISRLAQTIAQMHRVGILHPDFHAGNVLCAQDLQKIWIIDLYNCKKIAPLQRQKTLQNLVIFNRTFQLLASRTDRLRFFQKYSQHFFQASSSFLLNRSSKAEICWIEKETHQSNLIFWKHREQRCLKNNKYFKKIRVSGYHGYAKKNPALGTLEIPTEVFFPWIQGLSQSPPTLPPDSVWIKEHSRTTRVFKVTWNQQHYYVKQYLTKSKIQPFKNFWRKSRVFHSWFLGNSLITRGLLTGEPILALEQRRCGWLKDAVLVLKEIPSPKQHWLPSLSEERENCLHRLALTIRHLHDRGFSQRDLKGPNLLQGEQGFYFLDLDGMRQETPKTRIRCRDLGRLLYWLRFEETNHPLSPQEGEKLIQFYLGHPPKLNTPFEFYLRAIDSYLQKKTQQRQKKEISF